MTRADGKRQRAAHARKAERERRRAERKHAKREKATVPPPKPEADPVREGVAEAMRRIAQAGGVVLFGRDDQPFAFYPQHARSLALDPAEPARLREAVERRLEEGRAEAIRAVRAGLMAVGAR
jgi:hypothetical protein